MSKDSTRIGETLCTSCGLCCQGVFHTHAVINTPDDLTIARSIPAVVFEDDQNKQCFTLPCPAFDGKCSIFPARPSVCGAHKCMLLRKVEAREISLREAGERVQQTKECVRTLLPTLRELSENSESNHPEKLMEDYLSQSSTHEERARRKKYNVRLLLALGEFRLLKERHFYPQDNPMTDGEH